MKEQNKFIGDCGEAIALKFLQEKGYTLLEKNFRCNLGEIDLIAFKKNLIIFIEVKTRRNNSFGIPCEAVTIKKRHRIYSIAKYFIATNLGYNNHNYRFDVIEIYMGYNNAFKINHIIDAFWY